MWGGSLYVTVHSHWFLCAFSLREAIRDDNVQPKMQCLMMDSSFSMVTMQGEDSGIAWETTPSRCTTPWSSETGNLTLDLSSPVVRPATPGSVPAGKIIFVMDEEMISRRRKTKEKSKADRQREELQSSEDNLGRPELVGISQPNVKNEEEDEEVLNDLIDKEQKLFSLVSEGSEILNIVVPTKLATVDEEESKEMLDNLSYLEESLVPKANEETSDYEVLVSTTGSSAARCAQIKPTISDVMDPPGAPVIKTPGRRTVGNVDYFEAFHLIDAQAPGGPAVIAQEQVTQEAKVAAQCHDTETFVQAKEKNTTTFVDKSDTISLGQINSELLDEVFYGGTDNYLKNLEREDEVAEGMPARLPAKPSGSTLFGSQEDVLTPIFLPEGPQKIIDPILLEEPKAMAFLYTDLYEEAIGSRIKEEDTESITSEKSFHSRDSDREARGYLEKYVLIDETPVVEVELTDEGNYPEDGPRVLSKDFYDFGNMVSRPEKAVGVMPNSEEEEITDFFRSSTNSSPCNIEPIAQSLEVDEDQSTTKVKERTKKHVSMMAEKVAESPLNPLSISSFESPLEDLDWGSIEDHPDVLDEKHEFADQELWKALEVQKPIAPPRKKACTSKSSLDLTPLTPVDIITQEKEEAGGKEQLEEEKETASPAETADEGDEEEIKHTCSFSPPESVSARVEDAPQTESVKESNEITVKHTNSPSTEGKDTKTIEQEGASDTDAASKHAEPGDVDIKMAELDNTLGYTEKQGNSQTGSQAEPAKNKGQCTIL